MGNIPQSSSTPIKIKVNSQRSMAQSKSIANIQFYRGINESVVPEIRLTRSRDGQTGQAIFLFEKPDALSSSQFGEITGMTLLDDEGEFSTREVKARFVNGSPSALEVTYVWKTEEQFTRFMRFAEKYAKSNGLGYSKT